MTKCYLKSTFFLFRISKDSFSLVVFLSRINNNTLDYRILSQNSIYYTSKTNYQIEYLSECFKFLKKKYTADVERYDVEPKRHYKLKVMKNGCNENANCLRALKYM